MQNQQISGNALCITGDFLRMGGIEPIQTDFALSEPTYGKLFCCFFRRDAVQYLS